MGTKTTLIALPLAWNFVILAVYAGFEMFTFVTIFSSLLGVAIGLAVAGSIKVLGSGMGDEGIQIGFVAGTLSAFYGLLSLGVLYGQATTSSQQAAALTRQFGGGPILDQYYANKNSTFGLSHGGAENYLAPVPYGWIIQTIFALMFLLGVILWVTRGSE